MTEYRSAIYREQFKTRSRTNIRRAFNLFGRGQDTRLLESIVRINYINPYVYACAYLIILDKIEEEPSVIDKTEIFDILLRRVSDPNDSRRRTATLFQVYITIVMMRVQVPEDELFMKEGQERRSLLTDEADDNLVYGDYR